MPLRRRADDDDDSGAANRARRFADSQLVSVGVSIAISVLTGVYFYGHIDQVLTDYQKQNVPDHLSHLDTSVAELEATLKTEAALRGKDEEMLKAMQGTAHDDIAEIKASLIRIEDHLDAKADKPTAR
jgi:hypothetical protein